MLSCYFYEESIANYTANDIAPVPNRELKGNSVKTLNKLLLPALIALALGSVAASAQAGKQTYLFTSTDVGKTILTKNGQSIEIGPAEAAVADGSGIRHVSQIPEALGWPCNSQAARDRKFPAYRIDSLPEGNKAREIVKRYLEEAEVIEPVLRLRNGGVHGTFSVSELMQFVSPEYWYKPDKSRPILTDKRPDTLEISLYVGIHQAVADNYTFRALQEKYGDEIPTLFVFNDSNVVPISYFGPNVSMKEIVKAYSERGINIADVPMWELGDHHLSPTVSEFEKLFDIPSLESISPERQAALKADLEKYGFSRKPVFVSLLASAEQVSVDQPDRVRVAASMGIKRIPTRITVITPDVLVQHCGPGAPAGTSIGDVVSGGTTPIGGASFPQGSPVVPPPTDPAASDS